MKNILAKTFEGKYLNEREISTALCQIIDEKCSSEQAAALLGAISSRGVQPQELASFAKFMRSKSNPLDTQNLADLIDVCGTGGDRAGTFNISTTVCFVIAGAGCQVAKHGNRSVSSKSGSADVLEKLGVATDMPSAQIANCIKTNKMAFIFAPLYHPSMAKIKKVRESIGVPTIFNLLGPLVNPAKLSYQVIGVYEKSKCKLMASALLHTPIQEAMVVCGDGRLDEFSTTGDNLVYHIKNKKITEKIVSPEKLGLQKAKIEDLVGGDAQKNAQIILEILQGKLGAKRDIVLLNAAAALIVAGKAKDFSDGLQKARASIDSGQALEILRKLQNVSR